MGIIVDLLVHAMISAVMALMVCIFFEAYLQRRDDSRLEDTEFHTDSECPLGKESELDE